MKKSVLVLLIVTTLMILGLAWFSLRTSKEMLTAFGEMNKKLQEINDKTNISNDSLIHLVVDKELKGQVSLVDSLTTDFAGYLESVKQEMLNYNDVTDYEQMDASSVLFFDKNGLSKKGQKFVNQTDRFREGLLELTIGTSLKKEINELFSTARITARDGRKYDWLTYNFKDFPLVASITRLTQMQVDVSRIKRAVLAEYINTQE